MSHWNDTGHSRRTEDPNIICTGCGVAAKPGVGYALTLRNWPSGCFFYGCDACTERARTDDRFGAVFEMCARARLCVINLQNAFKRFGFDDVPVGPAEILAALENPALLAIALKHRPPGGYHPHPSA